MELTPKQKRKVDKIAKVIAGGELAIAEHLLEIEDKFEETIEQIKKEVPNLEKILEVIRGEDGDDYVLTDEDMTEIAQKTANNVDLNEVAKNAAKLFPTEQIVESAATLAASKVKVPVVEKVVEKTEVIKEVPNELNVDVIVEEKVDEKVKEQEERIKNAIKEYTDELFDVFKEDSKDAQSGYTDEVKTLQNRTQLLLQIATQRTNTSSTPSTPTDGWALTGNSGTTAGTNFIGTTDDEDFVVKTNSIERLRIKSFGSSDITELDLGSSTTTAGRIYFRDGQTESHRIDLEKNSSNMVVTETTTASGTATRTISISGDTDGFLDINPSTATRVLTQKPVRFMNSTNYVGLKAPATTPDDTDYSLPAADAVRSGGAITSNQSGVLSFDYFARLMGSNTSDSSAVANTTTETNFDITHTVQPDDINEVGTTFLVFAAGRASSSGTPSLRIRLKGGVSAATTLYDSAAQTMSAGVTDRPWMFLWTVTVETAGSSGQLRSIPIVNRIDTRSSTTAKTGAVVDLTFPCEFGISAEWSAASASNTATLDSLVVVSLNKR